MVFDFLVESVTTEDEHSVKGCHWGELKFSGPTVAFMVDDKQAFEFNLGVVSNAASAKKEAFVEFHKVCAWCLLRIVVCTILSGNFLERRHNDAVFLVLQVVVH